MRKSLLALISSLSFCCVQPALADWRYWNNTRTIEFASLMYSEAILGCAYKRGLLKSEHAEDWIIKYAVIDARINHGIEISPETFIKTRYKTFPFPALPTFDQNVQKKVKDLGGCSAIVNYELPQKIIKAIQDKEGGYDQQAPLHDVLEGTPFEW